MKRLLIHREAIIISSQCGKWCTLGFEGLFVIQVLYRCFLILEAVRGVSKRWEVTHCMLEGKIELDSSRVWPK